VDFAAQGSSCESYERQICAGYEECKCERCETDLNVYFSCLTEEFCDAFDCSSVVASPSPNLPTDVTQAPGKAPSEAPQSIPNFRASYVAMFGLLLDASCTINSQQQLEIRCDGEIVFEMTSDPSIQCMTSSSNLLTCINTCADSTTPCSNVFLAPANGLVSNGPFGEIYFQCQGDTVDDVKALLNYQDNGDGFCENVDDRVVKTGRLGVSCDGGTYYFVDDYFFECGSTSFSYALETDPLQPSEQYACIQGNKCNISSCSIPFDDLYVSSTPNQFDASCIESLNGLPITSTPTAAPVNPGNPVYQATFQTAWGLLSQGTSVSACASNEIPIVRIQCLNGGTIDFVESESATISCTKKDDSTLECYNSQSIMNSFPLVTYVSIDCTWPSTIECTPVFQNFWVPYIFFSLVVLLK
jgi:hypothetical protein